MSLPSLTRARRLSRQLGLVVASLLAAAGPAVAQPATPAPTPSTPAEQQIVWAQQAIDANPQQAQPYNELASALSRRARETGSHTFYDRAWDALSSALARDPNNFDAKKQQIAILLARHEFARAYDAAVAMNKQVPDDLLVYGYVADASIALGKYKEAEDAVQWMLDIRPGNSLGMMRAASLRELFGDVDGAVELFSSVFTRIPQTDAEERAWILSQIGRLHHTVGRESDADSALQQALTLFPHYHVAARALAQVRLAQGRAAEAVDLLQPLATERAFADDVYAFAAALDRAGRRAEATKAFARFEKLALAESTTPYNANHELVAYYVDRAGRPRDALRIAELEYARRQDIFTRDAYAWALAANGRRAEARTQIEAVLAIGTRDARILRHASAIQNPRNAKARALAP